MTAALPTALAELQAWPRWVCWRTLERDGKLTKVPVMYSGKPASTTDRGTWGRYSVCADAAEERGYDGIGYVFAEEDEYVGIDFDKCVTPPTAFAQAAGETGIHPAVAEIIAELGSYTEYSPTRTGLHVIVRAAFPEGGRNRTGKTPWGGEFECYDRARFFTITGDHVPGTPETIESRTQELAAVHSRIFAVPVTTNGKSHVWPSLETVPYDDVALEDKIRSSKQGAKFAGLYDRAAPEGQESESDLALCNILAFWLGPDPARIDSWFRRSALMRDKWDAKRGDTTYGGYTINRALEDRTEFYGQKKPPAKRPARDDVERDYGEELAEEFQLVDDPFVSGWKSGRTSRDRYVLTTRSGLVLDLDPIGSYAGSPAKLSAEAALQLGTEPDLKGKVLRVLRLMAAFCNLQEAETLDDRARDLGVSYLQEAPTELVDMDDQASRWAAFTKLRDITPGKAEPGSSIASQSLVLVDPHGNRYVRTQWFSEYVKAGSMPGTAADVNRRMQRLGWTKTGKQGRIKATSPSGHDHLVWSFHVVTRDWERDQDDVTWTAGDAR